MPVINTRKRKPSDVSALDQLAAISTQELASRRTFLPPAQRQRMQTGARHHEDDADANSGASSDDADSGRRVRQRYDTDTNDLDRLARDIEHMKLKLRRAEHALAARRASHSHPMQWSSTHTLAEILKLQATLETALAMDKNPGAMPLALTTATPHENFDCGPLMLEAIRRDVVRLHAFLTEHRVDPDLAQHVRLPLDHLWREARADAYTEVRTKLSFWKHEADDLKERLRVVLEAIKSSPTTAMPPTAAAAGTSTAAAATPAVPTLTLTPSPAVVALTVEAALERAMAFVSSFFLMDVATTSDGNAASKELALTTATTAIIRTVKELDEKRVETRPPLHSQPAVEFTSPRQPGGHGGGMMMQRNLWPMREPEPSPPSTSHSTTTNFFAADDDGDDPSEEDEPLPMQSPTYTNSASTAAQRTTDTSSVRAAAMSVTSTTTASQKKISLPLAARRRLAAVLDSQLSQGTGSQLQERSGWPSQAAKPSPLKQKHSTAGLSYQDRVDARPRNPLDLSGSRADTTSIDSPSTANGCAKCGRNDSQHSLLLCDNDCGREFHTFCLSPPLATIPDGDWFCPKCREAESLAPDQRVYLCSASLCDKITATKYCSLHRCQYERCLNRMHSNGLCRRHEGHRGTGKQPTGVDVSPSKANAKPVPMAMEPTPVPHKVPTAKAKLNNDQLLANMRDMGIWLPTRLPGKKSNKVALVKGGKKHLQGKRA